MQYERNDSFPFNFKSNGIPFVSNQKENSQQNHIPFILKGNRNDHFARQGVVIKQIN